MTSSARARHRAPLSARTWATRAWLAVSALPVGALAGCTALAVSAAAERPAVGLVGMGAALVPLTIATLRGRHADVAVGHGRRAAGVPVVETGALATTSRTPIVLDVPDLMSLQAATGQDVTASLSEGSTAEATPSRLFRVSSIDEKTGVDVVVLTRDERSARDLALLADLQVTEVSEDADSTDSTADREHQAA